MFLEAIDVGGRYLAAIPTPTIVEANLGHERLAVAGLEVALKGVGEILRVIRRHWVGQVGNAVVAVGGPPVVEAFEQKGTAEYTYVKKEKRAACLKLFRVDSLWCCIH